MYQDDSTRTAFHPQPMPPAGPPPVQTRIPGWIWGVVGGLFLLLLLVVIGLAGSIFYYNGKVKEQSSTAAALAEKVTEEVQSARTDAAAVRSTAEADAAAVRSTAEADSGVLRSEAQTQRAASVETIAVLLVEKESLSAALTAVPPTATAIPPTLEPTSIPLPELSYIYRSSDGTNSMIMLKSLGSSAATELLRLPGNMTGLAWSPDGSRIAFHSNASGAYDIYVMDATGANLQNITQFGNVDGDPLWSPDGSSLLFSGLPGATYEIYTIPANGGELTNLTQNAYNDLEPAWSPDGSWVVYSSDQDVNEYYGLYIVDAQGNNRRTITGETEFNDRNPVFSPDGNWIAFNGWDGDWDVLIIHVNDGTLINLTPESSVEDWSPIWSPDGTKIAYVSMTDGTNADIYLMNADGSDQRRLTTAISFDWQPAWSLDGQYISFESDMDGNWEIYLIDPYGAALINLTESAGTSDGEISWRP